MYESSPEANMTLRNQQKFSLLESVKILIDIAYTSIFVGLDLRKCNTLTKTKT